MSASPVRRILLIEGHPDAKGPHLNRTLADAYAQGATAGGHELRRVVVGGIDFPLLMRAADWLHGELLKRQYDLHLLLDPQDVPWVDDGQRCQPALAQRLTFYQHCEHWLRQHQQPLQCIQGNWAQRREQALVTVADWLNSTQ